MEKGVVVKKDYDKKGFGYMGKTGDSTGDHLHFELYNPKNHSKVINPWTTYYQGKIAVTIGGNSYAANNKYASRTSKGLPTDQSEAAPCHLGETLYTPPARNRHREGVSSSRSPFR